MLWPSVLLVVIGLLNAGCGYLIWRRRVYGLIAGYDPRHPPPNPERLARWIGIWSIVIGTWCMSAGVAIALLPQRAGLIVRVMAFGILPAAAITIVGAFKRAR